MNSAGRPLVSVYREALIARHYAHRTIDTYEHWLRRFLRFHLLRHPREMGGPEINAFLTHLAVEERVSASTQNQWQRQQGPRHGVAPKPDGTTTDPPARSQAFASFGSGSGCSRR